VIQPVQSPVGDEARHARCCWRKRKVPYRRRTKHGVPKPYRGNVPRRRRAVVTALVRRPNGVPWFSHHYDTSVRSYSVVSFCPHLIPPPSPMYVRRTSLVRHRRRRRRRRRHRRGRQHRRRTRKRQERQPAAFLRFACIACPCQGTKPPDSSDMMKQLRRQQPTRPETAAKTTGQHRRQVACAPERTRERVRGRRHEDGRVDAYAQARMRDGVRREQAA
jgi:hypothetical protein